MNLNIWWDFQICISVPLMAVSYDYNLAKWDDEIEDLKFAHLQ